MPTPEAEKLLRVWGGAVAIGWGATQLLIFNSVQRPSPSSTGLVILAWAVVTWFPITASFGYMRNTGTSLLLEGWMGVCGVVVAAVFVTFQGFVDVPPVLTYGAIPFLVTGVWFSVTALYVEGLYQWLYLLAALLNLVAGVGVSVFPPMLGSYAAIAMLAQGGPPLFHASHSRRQRRSY